MSRLAVQLALSTGRPVAEVESWDDCTVSTVLDLMGK